MIRPQRIKLPREVAETLAEGTRAYIMGECGVFVSLEPIEIVYPKRWHLSISHQTRFPTWGEIGEARDQLIPADVFMCVPFPPRAHWLSIHRNCFHLWEFRDDALREQMILEGEQAKEIGKGVPEEEGPR